MWPSSGQLRGEEPAGRSAVEAAARRRVREVTGSREPSRRNAGIVEAAVAGFADVAARVLAGLVVRGRAGS